MSEPATLVPGRSCEGCTLCCKLIWVPPLNKPRMVYCEHCKVDQGCGIYETRPDCCRDWFCFYRRDASLGEEWKPATCGMTVDFDPGANRINVCVDEGHFHVWREEPYYSRIKAMALDILRRRGHLIVWEGFEGIGVLPHADVRLGRPKPNQVVVAGRRVDENGEEFLIGVFDRDDPRLKPS